MAEEILICRCKEVSEQEIREAIADGAQSVTGVKRRTGAGMGLCQGRTCRRLVSNLIASCCHTTVDKLAQETVRPPVRPITMEEVLKSTERFPANSTDCPQGGTSK